MSEVRKVPVRRPYTQVLGPKRTTSIPAGAKGVYFSFKVDKNEKIEHSIRCNVQVIQPLGRTDLDIRVLIMDDENLHKWESGQPHTAFVIVPRAVYAGLTFSPPATGVYHVILDNSYSIFTSKEVAIEITENWTKEEEIEIPVVEKIVEKPAEIKKPPEIGRLKRFILRLSRSRPMGLIGLFVLVQIICIIAAILIAYLLHVILNLDYGDIVPYIATAIGGSAVVLLVIFFYLRTGRSVFPMVSPVQ